MVVFWNQMKQLFSYYFLFLILAVKAGNDDLPIGARSAGLANASVTLSDVWSVHHNQAGLGFLEKAGAGVYYENRFLIPELGLSAGVVAVPVKKGAFGLSIRNFGYQLYNESKFGIGYGRSFGDKLSIGMQLNMLNVRFADVYGARNAFTAEVGAIYRLSSSLTVATHINNPTRTKLTELDADRLPTILRFGLRYQFSKKVFIAGEAQKDTYNKAQLRFGLEYMASDVFFLRAGIASNPINSSFGFGLKLKKLMLDFAGSFHQVLGFTPQFSLTYQFKD
jgi:hypothetical protein